MPEQNKKLLVIVAAGPGIGLAAARRFGREGFRVTLVARGQEHLDDLVATLTTEGIEADARIGDVTDEHSLTAALDGIAPDVLLYNGAGAGTTLTASLDITRDSAQQAFDAAVLGAITAVRAVLPAMQERGSGTLLFTSGLSALHPFPFLGNVGIAVSGLRNYVLALAKVVADKGVHVGHLPIGARIEPGSPASLEAIAEAHWRFYTERNTTEVVLGSVELVENAIAQVAGR